MWSNTFRNIDKRQHAGTNSRANSILSILYLFILVRLINAEVKHEVVFRLDLHPHIMHVFCIYNTK